ncbi:HNH endonuclease [Agromyces mediolanus]|uniref:HNH endonuclease signature motif containing protein n=1 Tax=Agromyces mediolanus TaxID=41986 RepID=UPI00203B9F02|nr:HNH endonuclease signature motif containing protein [Agromyces mediolanus]MCM3655701.1 HNH endonuclease [Agromyces mediolanus]
MTNSSTAPAALAAFSAAAAAVGTVWQGALTRPSSRPEADARAMSDDGLVRAIEAIARLSRLAESLQARVAAELDDRCSGIAGDDLAKARGCTTPERLIAQLTAGRYVEAARLVAVGRATATHSSFAAETLPPKRPELARALHDGLLGLEAADVIRRFLDRVELRADPDELAASEAFLVERAPVVGVDGLGLLVKRLEARLDPDGVKPREDELRARRGLRIWQDRAGMVNVRGAFDPVNGAVVTSAIDALVGAELHRARDARAPQPTAAEPRGDQATSETRTIAQLNADALADLARHALGCSDVPTLRSVTVVVRADAEELVAGRGAATIDGIEQPVSLESVRELIGSAGISPMLVGRGELPLRLGRSARLFTTAQKLALAERDGGCAWPGCRRPPSHTEAHHIAWWGRDAGTTDLDNGILLCSHHHHRVHDDGWVVRVRDGRSWFIPPAHLDPQQVPRPGNRPVRPWRDHGARSRTPAVVVA